MLLQIFLAFVSFPNKEDALFSNSQKLNPQITASGSLGLYFGDEKCQQTYPNQTLVEDKNLDWCSNIASPGKNSEMPWISFSYPKKSMRLTGYAVRNGCCRYSCCCDATTGKVIDYYCCCRLYSFSLQGSNDNRTWKTIHKIEKANDFYRCTYKIFEFQKTEPFNYIRFVLDEEWPGCPKCMQINQIELYGNIHDSYSFSSFEDNDEETVSIIGKIKRS